MKALTLKQPYAELVVSGKKTIELRRWNTKFRGEFLIHTSKISDEEAMKKFGYDNLPCGFIIGKAVLTKVKHYLNEEEHTKDNDKHLANNNWGNYGFVLEKACRTKMIEAKGTLGFWEWKE